MVETAQSPSTHIINAYISSYEFNQDDEDLDAENDDISPNDPSSLDQRHPSQLDTQPRKHSQEAQDQGVEAQSRSSSDILPRGMDVRDALAKCEDPALGWSLQFWVTIADPLVSLSPLKPSLPSSHSPQAALIPSRYGISDRSITAQNSASDDTMKPRLTLITDKPSILRLPSYRYVSIISGCSKLLTSIGTCSWEPPIGAFLLPRQEDGEWWELADSKRGNRSYYYSMCLFC
jgi:hypothetical protein